MMTVQKSMLTLRMSACLPQEEQDRDATRGAFAQFNCASSSARSSIDLLAMHIMHALTRPVQPKGRAAQEMLNQLIYAENRAKRVWCVQASGLK